MGFLGLGLLAWFPSLGFLVLGFLGLWLLASGFLGLGLPGLGFLSLWLQAPTLQQQWLVLDYDITKVTVNAEENGCALKLCLGEVVVGGAPTAIARMKQAMKSMLLMLQLQAFL